MTSIQSLESLQAICGRGALVAMLASTLCCEARPSAPGAGSTRAPTPTPSLEPSPPARCPAPERRADRPQAGAAPVATAGAGYDQALSAYAYPYDVSYLPLTIQQAPLCMAYMDVAPAVAPSGESVLLLHGKNFSGAYWEATAARLSERGHRVIMPDQIGFGKSSKPTTIQYSFDLLAQSTAHLLDHLGVAEVVVVGHSMGGMLAVRFATAYAHRSSKLVLVNPIGLEDYRRVVPYLGVDAWTAQAAKQTPEGLREYMRQSYFHGDWRPEYEPLLEIQVGWLAGPDAKVLARVSGLTQDMLYTEPVSYDFPNIKAPTLLVIGQLDRTAPGKSDVPAHEARMLGNYPDLGERAARAIPRSQLVKLEQVGHVPQLESFDAWMKAVEGFLASGSARALDKAAPAPH